MNIEDLIEKAHTQARRSGFYDGNINETHHRLAILALIHSEISEAVEAVRKPGPDSKLPQFSAEVVELADAVIRIADYCGAYSLPLEDAIVAKMEYNKTRPYKHGKKA